MRRRVRCSWPGLMFMQVVLVAGVGGCQPEEVDESATLDALEERMSVRVLGEAFGEPDVQEVPRADFLTKVRAQCLFAMEFSEHPLGPACASPTEACIQHLCEAETRLCVANQLLSYARIVAPEEIDWFTGGDAETRTIPPQSPATNAGLAEMAGLEAQGASYSAFNALWQHRINSGGGSCLPAELPAPDGDTLDGQVYAANILAEAYLLATGEAHETMGEFTTAVADAYFSDEAQIRDATELAHVAPLLSRAWYAHALMGGSPGLPAVQEVSEEGFCSEARLSPDAERALELLRVAALPPVVVLDIEGTTMDDLWTGSGWPTVLLPPGAPAPSPENGSLRGRLSVLLVAPHLASATPGQIYERFGLSEGAFMEARAHMASELRAFGRDTDQLQPPDPIHAAADSDTLGVILYAATRNRPAAPLASYYGAVASYDAALSTSTPQASWPGPYYNVLIDGDFVSTAHFADVIASFVTELLTPDLVIGLFAIPPLAEGALDVLSLTMSDAARQREGRVQVCHDGALNPSVDVRVWGDWLDDAGNPAEHLLVRGHAGVQCAVRGSVENVACDLDDYIVESTSSFDDTDPSRIEGFARRLTLSVNTPGELVSDPMLADDGALLFVVRPRLGGAIAGRHPGAYESVAGFFVPQPPAGAPAGLRCQTIPVTPELEQVVSDAIAPSTTYCAMSAMNCAGLPLDQLVPLENELTDDFDPVESSWRRYLTLARNQADEADRLGEDLIRSGLEQDVRAEQAIDELENICGVSINIEALNDPMSAMNETGQACDEMIACSAGYRCVNEACAPDPVQIALASASTDDDRRRLIECLGEDTIVPWTTLGAAPLCMWWDGSDPSTICEGRDGEHPCPFEGTVPTSAPGAEPVVECPEAEIPARTGSPYVAIPVPYALGFFIADPDDDGGGEVDETAPCWAIAQLRGAFGEREHVGRVMSAPQLSVTELRWIASRLNWRPAPGDFSTVTVDDIPFLSTGSHLSGPGSRWPCGPRPWEDQCPAGASVTGDPTDGNPPLFCIDMSGDCSADPLDSDVRRRRAQMNDLLARAVLAARITTGASPRGLHFPYYARSQDTLLEIPEEEGGWRTPTRFDGETVNTTRGSLLRITNPGGELGSSDEYKLFDMNRGSAYVVVGPPSLYSAVPGFCTTIPWQAEWSNCPWDLNLIDRCVEIFDDQPDCDDPRSITDARQRQLSDRDVGMIVRSFGTGADGEMVATSSVDLWRRATRRRRPGSSFVGEIEEILNRQIEATLAGVPERYARDIALGPATPNIEELSRYWQRSQCGAVDHHNCGGETFAEMDRRARETADCFSTDPSLPRNSAACAQAIGCFQRHGTCFHNAEENEIEFPETFDGNRAFIAPRGLTDRDVLNGLELMCAASRIDRPGGSRCAEPPIIESVGDLFAAAEHLDCVAAEIETSASRVILRDMPQRSVTMLQRGGNGGVYGGVSGEYAAAVDELRAALIEVSDISETLASTTRAMATEVRAVRSDVSRFNVQTEIADWQLVSTTANQITSCAIAVVNSIKVDSITGIGGGLAGITCANSAIQIGVAARITDLQQEDARLGVASAFARFESNYTTHIRALAGTSTQLRAAFERINAARTRIVNLQRTGRRALSRALFLDADATGRQYPVNTVMRRRHNTLAIRYRAAHRRAVRMAYLAKLALEQRLGMQMDRMTEPLPLLDEPPADWHMDVCSMTGIDYDRIRNANPGATGERGGDDAALDVPVNYAGEYVGDYVRRLEAVFESYSLAFPFQDGTDTAVLSLRDELWGIRAMCTADVPNLLYEAGHLDTTPSTDGTRVGWGADGCIDYDPWPPDGGEDAPPRPNCVTAVSIIEPPGPAPAEGDAYPATGPIPRTAADFGRVGAFRVEFGDEVLRAYPDGSLVTDGAGAPAVVITEDTALTEWVELAAGRYRVSYYARTPVDDAGVALPHGIAPQDAVRAFRGVLVADPGGGGDLVDAIERLTISPTVPLLHPLDSHAGWDRYYFFIDVPVASPVGIAVVPTYGTSPTFQVADVAALMLEDVSGRVTRDPNSAATDPAGMTTTVAATFPPAAFFDTEQTRTRELEVCEDTTGSRFRQRAWTRGCSRLCPDGYGGGCSALSAETHCYYQTSFTLDPEQLERAGLLGGGGLAFGNFNYRIDGLAINLVGTSIRDCTGFGGSTPATCYASGNVAYSVIHEGPYWVRNHTGGLYSAPLFTGRIERARALATERYVTNPLSSADRGLVEPYTRSEFRGRPMPGTFLLRIWDDPSLRFDRVEDVQLILNYRYWTRQE